MLECICKKHGRTKWVQIYIDNQEYHCKLKGVDVLDREKLFGWYTRDIDKRWGNGKLCPQKKKNKNKSNTNDNTSNTTISGKNKKRKPSNPFKDLMTSMRHKKIYNVLFAVVFAQIMNHFTNLGLFETWTKDDNEHQYLSENNTNNNNNNEKSNNKTEEIEDDEDNFAVDFERQVFCCLFVCLLVDFVNLFIFLVFFLFLFVSFLCCYVLCFVF